jgi:hypothetical protein
MPTSEGNGQGESRLDRIERLMQLHVIENHEEHAEFRREHRVLLSAQVVMVDKMTTVLEAMAKLDVKMLETTENLEALIRIVDGIVQRGQQG